MKKIKKFFTLSRRAEGFTLVELIVVIAILAILGGVAVPAYGGYVKKANMTADQQLASEVAHALSLHYYSRPTEATTGWVVLGTDETMHDANEFGTAAMNAVFGDNWRTGLELKYSDWGVDDGLTSLLGEDAGIIAKSAYMSDASSEDLMNTVTSLTNAAATALTGRSGALKSFMGDDFVNQLNEKASGLGVKADTDEYNTLASNMMVTYLANEFANYDIVNDPGLSDAGNVAFTYASMYAFALTDETALAEMNELNEKLAKADSKDAIVEMVGAVSFSDATAGRYNAYLADNEADSSYYNDTMAFLSIMKTVNALSDELTDVNDPNLYKSAQVASLLDNYKKTVNALAGLDAEAIAELKSIFNNKNMTNCIIVLIGSSGAICMYPNSAFLTTGS